MTKRLTKADVYKINGIEYDTDTENIFHPRYGWIKPLLKTGNTKTGRRCFTWSMPAGTDGTCVCDCPNCYAKTGCYCFSDVKDSLARNQWISENDIDFFRRAISAQIQADKIQLVRIHAAGDFATKNHDEYIGTWKLIIAEYPAVKFWTYTKISTDESAFDTYNNANIVRSLLPDNMGLNYGTCEEILCAYETLTEKGYNPYICECGLNDDKHCQDCSACSQNKYVLFLKHSCRNYDCKTDPLRFAVLDIIEKQRKEGK